jgi:hypothetical protein
MDTTEKFIKHMITIDEMEEGCGDYGHYPFQMAVTTQDDKKEVLALALGGDVIKCYQIFKKKIDEGATRVMMSLDFPPTGDIKKDFVCVYTYWNKRVKLLAIPYTLMNGKTHSKIRKSTTLEMLKKQFIEVVFP